MDRELTDDQIDAINEAGVRKAIETRSTWGIYQFARAIWQAARTTPADQTGATWMGDAIGKTLERTAIADSRWHSSCKK